MTLLVTIGGTLSSQSDFFSLQQHLPPSIKLKNIPYPQTVCAFNELPIYFSQQLQCEKDAFVLLGYSLGARVVMEMMRCCHLNIKCAVLLSAHAGIEDLLKRKMRLDEDRELALRLTRETPQDFFKKWWTRGNPNGVFCGITTSLMDIMIEERIKSFDPKRAMLEINNYSLGHFNYLKENEIHLLYPVYALAGALDTKYVEQLVSLQRGIPALLPHIVPSSSHLIHRENPSYLAQFLSKL